MASYTKTRQLWLPFALAACLLIAVVVAMTTGWRDEDEAHWQAEAEGQWLGMELENLTVNMREGLSLRADQTGVLVSDVVGLAATAGIQEGDVVTAVDQMPVVDMAGFATAVRATRTDRPVSIAVMRRGAPLSISVGPAAPMAVNPTLRPAAPGAQQPGAQMPGAQMPGAGTLAMGTGMRSAPVQIPQMGMEVADSAGGVAVYRVYIGSWAQHAGLAANDIITSFNGVPITDVTALAARIAQAPAERAAALGGVRGGQGWTKQVNIGEGDLNGVTVPKDAAPPLGQRAAGKTVAAQRGAPELLIREIGMAITSAPGTGVTITGVMGKSFAKIAGLRAGDVVTSVGRSNVRDAQQFQKLIAKALPEKKIKLHVLRNGRAKSFSVMVGEGEMDGFVPIPPR